MEKDPVPPQQTHAGFDTVDMEKLEKPDCWSAEVRGTYRRLTQTYLVALCLIAVLSIGIHFTLHAAIGQEHKTGEMIDRAGSQRMLSQRIAWMAETYVSLPAGEYRSRVKEMMAELVDRMEISHGILTGAGEDASRPVKYSEALDTLYFAQPVELDLQVRTFLSNALLVLEADADQLSRSYPPLVDLRIAARDQLLDGLDLAVKQMASDSQASVDQIQSLAMALLMAVGVILIVEGVFVFRPAVHRVATASEHLRRLARTDPLTGCLNRRSFFEGAALAMEAARDTKTPISVLAIDIDRFKRVNDTYGHGVGDLTIKQMVSVCLRNTREETDLLGRLGGEEFAIVLPGADAQRAASVAEKLRKAIEASTVTWDDGSLTFTASIGLSAIDPEDNHLEMALERADQALYKAKESGRNRVVSYAV